MSAGGVAGYADRHATALMRSLPVPQTVFVRGEGSRVQDADGRWYLDFLAGIAVNALGHAHPVFVEAVARQAATLAHVSNYFATPPQIELAERLLRLTGGDRVFLGNSGAEAIEASLKLARLTGRPRILSLEGAFHGRTLGATSIAGKAALRDAFEPLLPGTERIPADLDALAGALAAGGVAALVVEPIQGEAGVVDLPAGFLAGARHLTREHGALLILDEIQTGAGRTGEWFAFQHADLLGTDLAARPDAVALAKGIGGGFPVGAMVASGAAADLLGPGTHGSTYGGNPLASAVSGAVLEEIERAGLVANAATRGAQLREAVLGLGSPLVAGLSGRGLLTGVALTSPVATEVMRAALELGLIVNAPNDSRIRLAPPLIVGDAELTEFTDLFGRALARVADATSDGSPA